MMVASMRRAVATPKPICWNMTSWPAAKPAKTATMISAAPVMIRAVEAAPATVCAGHCFDAFCFGAGGGVVASVDVGAAGTFTMRAPGCCAVRLVRLTLTGVAGRYS